MAVPNKAVLFIWNKKQTGTDVEFEEKGLFLTKASVLTGKTDDTGEPIALTGATAGHVLKIVDVGSGNLQVQWAAEEPVTALSGTTNESWYIGDPIAQRALLKRWLADGGGTPPIEGLAVKKGDDTGHIHFKAERLYAIQGTPESDLELTSKLWVETKINQSFAANDAMVFKGSAANASALPLTGFSAGWSYRSTAAFTFGTSGTPANNIVLENGDMLVAIKNHDASYNVATNVSTYWTAIQSNLDGAVIGPANAASTGNFVALFDGDSGKLLKRGTGVLGTGAYAAAYEHPTTAGNKHIPTAGSTTQILQWDSAGTAKWVTVSADITIANNGAATIAASAVSESKIANNAVTTTKINAGAVTFAKIENSATAGLSVIGRSVNTAGVFAEINAAADHQALRRLGNTLGFGRISSEYLELGNSGAVATPTAYNAGAGTYIGQVTFDGNFLYVCITPGATGVARWVRTSAAKVW